MKRLLITGATGNVGRMIIEALKNQKEELTICVAARNVKQAKQKLQHHPKLLYSLFDFETTETFKSSFKEVDIIFLLRPPQISDVNKIFKPLLEAAKENGIKKIIFLSVQGVEKSKFIPHYKIESLIKQLGFEYIFIRPTYFMQNLTGALLPEIKAKRQITLPSGRAKFNWIDVKNIGEVTANLILSFESFKNRAYEITGSENKTFAEVSELMTEVLGYRIYYKSINPISFFFKKRKEGLKNGFAFVMTILHFLPRFQDEIKVSNIVSKITGKAPTTLKEFIRREEADFGS